MTFSACSTVEPSIVTRTEYVHARVPAALLAPCEKKQRGPLLTTGAIVSRLTFTEGALDRCAAKLAGVAKWDAGQQQ